MNNIKLLFNKLIDEEIAKYIELENKEFLDDLKEMVNINIIMEK